MSSVHRDVKIVVVGAGISGLSAAESLIKAGFQNVTILESKGRVGGRIHTTRPFNTNVTELGANWIHGQKGNPLFQMAKEHDLLIREPSANEMMCLPCFVTPNYYFFQEDGTRLSAEVVNEVCSLFGKLTSKAFNAELENKHKTISFGSYLDISFLESPLASSEGGMKIYEWCKRCETTDEAASLYDVSASQIGYYTALEGGFFNSLGAGGYQAILDIILRNIPTETILTNSAVKSIKWDRKKKEDRLTNHPVQVICENGQSFEADHVIVTVSLGVLKRQGKTMFEPVLPKSKLDAIERLGFGIVDKIFLCFNESFWPEDCSGVQLVWNEGPEDKHVYTANQQGDGWKKIWFKKISGFDTVTRHPTVLCGWITGREALYMETLQDSEITETCLRLLRSFTGWSVPDVSKVQITRWGLDPDVLGSYTFVPHLVNGVKEHEALAAPIPNLSKVTDSEPLQVLFAGEATQINYYTTTHGAYLSGVQEAESIIQHYTR